MISNTRPHYESDFEVYILKIRPGETCLQHVQVSPSLELTRGFKVEEQEPC
jgi:hypothetical protein